MVILTLKESTVCYSTFLRLWSDRSSKVVPRGILKELRARSTIWQWLEDYDGRESHNHRGGNGRPQISTAVRNQIGDLLINESTIYLRAAVA